MTPLELFWLIFAGITGAALGTFVALGIGTFAALAGAVILSKCVTVTEVEAAPEGLHLISKDEKP